MKHRALSLMLALAMVPIISCSERVETDPGERTTTYRVTKIDWPEHFGADIFNVSSSGGRVFVNGWETDPEKVIQTEDGWIQDQNVFSCDAAGENLAVEVLKAEEGYDKIASMAYTDDGEKFVTLTKMNEKSAFERVTVRRYDADGELFAEYECGELFEIDISKLRVSIAGEGGFFVRDAYKNGSDTIIVSNTGVAVLDKSGVRKLLIESRDQIMDSAWDGERLLLIYENGCYIADLAAGIIGEKLELPDIFDASRDVQLFGLEGYELAVRDDDGVWGLNRDESGKLVETQLCSFTNSGIVGTAIYGFTALSPEVFFAITANPVTNERAFYRLEMIPRSELSERTTIDVASLLDMEYYANYAVVDFNLCSDTHLATFRSYDYVTKDDGTWDTTRAVETFDLDMMSGDIPDVIIIPNTNIQLQNYVDIGLFADLYALMDADPDFEREDILEPIRRIFEQDGKLPYIPVASQITLNYATRPIGDWNLETAFGLLDGLAEDEQLTPRFLAYTMIGQILSDNIEQFVDFNTAEVRFDTPEFRRFYDYYQRAEKGEFTSNSEDVTTLITSYYYARDALRTSKLLAQNEYVEIVGAPQLSRGTIWAISDQCQSKMEAWEILKIRISDKYMAAASGSSTAPLVTESAFDAWCEKELSKTYYFTDGSTRILSEPMTQKECEAKYGAGLLVSAKEVGSVEFIRGVLESVQTPHALHQRVLNIVEEELYESASKSYSADETIKRIQNRVELLVSEKAG